MMKKQAFFLSKSTVLHSYPSRRNFCNFFVPQMKNLRLNVFFLAQIPLSAMGGGGPSLVGRDRRVVSATLAAAVIAMSASVAVGCLGAPQTVSCWNLESICVLCPSIMLYPMMAVMPLKSHGQCSLSVAL
jgi:hypothetical protein